MKTISVPGSKSISNRVLLLASLSDKPVILKNLLKSDDTVYMRDVLSKFGVIFEDFGKNRIKVNPSGFNLANNREKLFIGNAGTAARFLSCVSLLLEDQEKFTLDGIERMRERPQEDLFRALRQVGIDVNCLKNEGFLPAEFSKSIFKKKNVIRISGKVSSQFISGLLLVAPKLRNGLVIEVLDEIPSWPYIKMTLDILEIWGVSLKVDNNHKKFEIFSGISAPKQYKIPSDMSSASYPVLWSILKNEEICIDNFGSKTLQGDEKFLKIAEKSGAKIKRKDDKCFIYPPNKIKALGDVDFSAMPDVSMTGMVLSSVANGKSCFTGLESLRVKECDRIVAMEQLKNFGVDFEIKGDDVIIKGKNLQLVHENKIRNSKSKIVNSFDDHRIAMCFGVLRMSLDLGVDIYNKSWFKILDLNCVTKTWPNFWLDFAKIEGQLRLVSAVIVQRQTTLSNSSEYLIVKKPRKDFAWQFPQGGVEDKETLLQAAKRELKEECGKNLSVKFRGEKPIGFYNYIFPEDFIRHDENIIGAQIQMFKAEYLDGRVDVDNDEIIDYAWVTYEELSNFFEKEYIDNVQNFLK